MCSPRRLCYGFEVELRYCDCGFGNPAYLDDSDEVAKAQERGADECCWRRLEWKTPIMLSPCPPASPAIYSFGPISLGFKALQDSKVTFFFESSLA